MTCLTSWPTILLHVSLCLKRRKPFYDMTLNMVQPKNILSILKCKRPINISNIKQVYTICVLNNKAIRGDKTEMQ